MAGSITYYSTNLKAKKIPFPQALLKGQAPDKGLYMPDRIPQLTKEELKSFHEMPYYEIAWIISKKYLANEIPDEDLLQITQDAYNYDIPLERVYDKKYMMRLDQGPTASFKDFAARLMGRWMQYFLQKEDRRLLILTATSGDTGSAIANAFYGLENIQVVILYPETEVTYRQRKQMTTLNKNIQIIALNGKFDDCQAMVKKAFADTDLNVLELSSANSINIGRLLPQSIYYIYAYSKLVNAENDEIIFSVPSGNFGDLMGGLLAKHMGLPVKRFVISTNANDEVPVYFTTGKYTTIVPSINCISSAMNVGHPSNMARIVTLYNGIMNEKGKILKQPDLEWLQKDMYAVSINDSFTKQTISEAFKKHQLLLEPHGAVGWAGLHEYFKDYPEQNNTDQICVCLETAHPAKFPKEITEILGIEPSLPKSMKGLDDLKEQYLQMENDYQVFKDFLKSNY